MRFEFLKMYAHHHKIDSFPILKGFPDEIDGDTNNCEFFLLYNEMCGIWKIYVTASQYFPNDQDRCDKIIHG